MPPGEPGGGVMGRRSTVRCPFWTQTRRGTVRCELTGDEEWDVGERWTKAIRLLGAERADRIYRSAGNLQDEIKTCGINTNWQVYEVDPAGDESASAVDEYLERLVAQPPGPLLSDVSVGQFVWHQELGFGLVTDRFADYHGLGLATLVLFRWDVGEERVLLSDRLLYDDPLPAGAAPPDRGADPLDAAFASMASRLAAVQRGG